VILNRRQHAPPHLREVFEEHGPFVLRSWRHFGVHEADLDDLLQEVFLVVYKRLNEYEERGRTRAWLYSICTRIARAQRRKLGRQRDSVSTQWPEEPAPASQHAALEDRQALALGYTFLNKLPEQQRDVFLLYEVENLPMAEIARALECPLQTAYSRLHKARERILAEVQRAASRNIDHE
jgi:RNA polymerase sigma-70 factor, ECF subfamily